MEKEENVATINGPMIYVASLADYNAGRLVGQWICANQPADAIYAEIASMLKQSLEPNAEEWAIHDYEGFGCLRVDEFDTIENVADWARLIDKHGPIFGELVAHVGGPSDVEDAKRYMEDGYRGSYERLEDFVREFVEDCYADALKQLPEFLRCHIDYDGIARDMKYSGDIFTISLNGEVHVFWWNC